MEKVLALWMLALTATAQRVTDEDFSNIFKTYVKNERPNFDGAAVQVSLSAYLLSLPQIDSIKQEISWNLYLRQKWTDPRFSPIRSEASMPAEYHSKIWTPDTFIVNEVNSKFHDTTVPNMMVKVQSGAAMLMSKRYTVTTSCPMDFRNFPFDEQICQMEFESYGYMANDITYDWMQKSGPFGVDKSKSYDEFNIVAVRTSANVTVLSSGTYSRAMVEILIRRESGRYNREFFLPCTLLVIVSFCCLSALTPMWSLLLTFFSFVFTILFGAMSTGNLENPRMGYSTALDEYFVITMSFQFIIFILSLIQFSLSRCQSRPESVQMNSMGAAGRTRMAEDDDSLCEEGQGRQKKSPVPPSRIEAGFIYVGEFVLGLMFLIKPILIALYLLVIFIYWVSRPYAGLSDADKLQTDNWRL